MHYIWSDVFLTDLDITEEQPERFGDEDYPFCTLDTENEEDDELD